MRELTGVEKAMFFDDLDASGVDRLVEDENENGGIFTEDEGLEFADVPDYMFGIGSF